MDELFEVIDRSDMSECLSDEHFYTEVLVSYFTDHKPTAQQKCAARAYWRVNNCLPDYIEVFPGIIVGWIDGVKQFRPILYDAYTGEFLRYIDGVEALGDLPYIAEIHLIGRGKLYQEEL